jgi:hypothetical protein
MSAIARISGVFFEPKKTFEDIARRPTWLVPLILLIIASLAASFAMSQRIGWDRIVRQQVESSSRAQQLPAEQREQQIAMGVKIASAMAYVGSIVFVPILFVIVAGVLLGIASMMSAGVKFKQVLSVVSWGWLPNLIKTLIMIVVIYLKNPDEFNMKNPLAFNLGAFLEPDKPSKFLYSIASSLDLFTIWAILLIAVGLKAAAGKKLSFAGAVVAVVLPWAIFVLAAAAFAGVTG